MNRYTRLFPLCVAVAAVLGACAGPRYRLMSPGDLPPTWENGKKAGVPFYEAKPFLLVTRSTDAKGTETLSAVIISLPDKTKPYAARVGMGLGSAKLNLTMANGVLVSTASEVGPDTISALLGAIGTAVGVPAGIGKVEAETAKLVAETAGILDNQDGGEAAGGGCTDPQAESWRTQVSGVRESVANLDDFVKDYEGGDAYRRTVVFTLDDWRTDLCNDAGINKRVGAEQSQAREQAFLASAKTFHDRLANVVTVLERLVAVTDCEATPPRSASCGVIQDSLARLKAVVAAIGKFVPTPTKKASFELYEILYDPDTGAFEGLQEVRPKTLAEMKP